MYRSKLLDRAKADRTADLVWRPADRRRVNGVWHKALTAASLYGSPLCQEKSCFWCWVAPPPTLHSQPLMHQLQPFWNRGQDLSANVHGDCCFWTSCCDDAGWPLWAWLSVNMCASNYRCLQLARLPKVLLLDQHALRHGVLHAPVMHDLYLNHPR